MAITFADLIAPLTLDAVRAEAFAILAAAFPEVPSTAWGETDEPRAVLEFESTILAGLSGTIAQVATLAVLRGNSGDSLTLHARERFGVERDSAQVLRGSVTLGDTTGTPQVFAAGALIFVTTDDPELVYRNEAAVTVPASSTTAVAIVAESPGAKYVVQGSTLSLGTPLPGLTLTVSPAKGWITTEGTDEQSDEELILECETKVAGMSPRGPTDAYVSWVLGAVPGLNRVRVQEDPLAVPPTPSVTVIVAGTAGAAGATSLASAVAVVETYRPTGVLVETVSAAPYAYDLRGPIRVRTAQRAAAETEVRRRLRLFFEGTAQTINGELLEGLGIGSTIYLSQVIEIVMSVPGVVSFTPTNSSGTPLAPTTDDVTPSLDGVAVLNPLYTFANV